MPFTVSYASRPSTGAISPAQSADPQRLWDNLQVDVERKERLERWVSTNAPKPLPLREQRHFFRLIVASAVLFHEERQSVGLLKRVIAALTKRDPAALEEFDITLKSKPKSGGNSRPRSATAPTASGSVPPASRLNRKTILQMCDDIDYLLKNYSNGSSLAAQVLTEFNLWEVEYLND
jgi:hypothetical protein